MVNNESGARIYHDSRTSSSAYLPQSDPIVRRLIDRVLELQGYVTPWEYVDVQVTKYDPGQYYRAHNDWCQHRLERKQRDRLSTLFLILEAECDDCGTEFLALDGGWKQRDPRWCRYFDCTRETVTTRNIPGAGLFWTNLDKLGEAEKAAMT